MHQERLVEALMLYAAALPLDVVVAHVNLAGLAEARQLLVGGLGADDPGRLCAQIHQPHRESALEQRVEFQEPGPGFVEQDVVTQMADPFEDHLCIIYGAIICALLDHRTAERARLLPGFGVCHQRIAANRFAELRLIPGFDVDRPDQPLRVPVRFQKHRNTAAKQQRAVMRCLVVVAIEQHQIAIGNQRGEHNLVRGRGAVEHEIGSLGAKDLRRLLLCLQCRAFMDQQIAQIEHRIVDVVAKDVLAHMFEKDPPHRRAAIKHAAIMARAGPKLIAFLVIVEQRAKERGAQCLGVLPQARGEVLGNKFRRLFCQEHVAIRLVQHLDRDLFQPVMAHQNDDRRIQPTFADELNQRRHLAHRPASAPVDHHASNRGVGADHQFRVVGLAGFDDTKADLLDLSHNLRQPLAFQILGVKHRGAHQKFETALILHRLGAP